MLWWINKHKHSASNVFIFRVIIKCFLGNSAWNFFGLSLCSRDFLFGFWFFSPWLDNIICNNNNLFIDSWHTLIELQLLQEIKLYTLQIYRSYLCPSVNPVLSWFEIFWVLQVIWITEFTGHLVVDLWTNIIWNTFPRKGALVLAV